VDKKLTAKDIAELISDIKRYDHTFSKGDAEILWVFKMIGQDKLSVKEGALIAVHHCIYGNASGVRTSLLCHLGLDQIKDNLKGKESVPFRKGVVILLNKLLTNEGLHKIKDYLKDIEVPTVNK
jgi:hypothetical protein